MRIRFLAIACVLSLFARPGAAQPRPTANDEQRANLHYRTGWELLSKESWAAAAAEFQAAIDINPQFKLAYYGLGRADMGQKKFPDAIRAYEKCRELHEAQASRNFSNKADADRVVADDVMQIDMTIGRLQAMPPSASTSTQIGQLQAQKQRLQNRLRAADTLSLTSPVPAFISLALGSAYLRAERFPDAERAYRAAVEIDPKYGEAHSNLAALYLITGRYEEAENAVKAAEKTGFKVNPGLKDDIKKRKAGGGQIQ
jgi:tetratricopeptide (TPR) repeat protein